MTRTSGMDLDDEGIYRLAAAVMIPPGYKRGLVLDDQSHRNQLAWLKGLCGEFWMAVMALIPADVTSRYGAMYEVESGPARDCVTGECRK
jgi:hypothetical protein